MADLAGIRVTTLCRGITRKYKYAFRISTYCSAYTRVNAQWEACDAYILREYTYAYARART